MDRGRVARSTVDQRWRILKGTRAWRCAHRSLASDHFGARELVGGGATERGEHGEPGAGLTEARASCGNRAMAGKWRQRENLAMVVLKHRERGRCSECQRGHHPFIGAGGRRAPGILWPASMPGLEDAGYLE
jgi:hypothetical protein